MNIFYYRILLPGCVWLSGCVYHSLESGARCSPGSSHHQHHCLHPYTLHQQNQGEFTNLQTRLHYSECIICFIHHSSGDTLSLLNIELLMIDNMFQFPSRLMEWAVLFNSVTEQEDIFNMVLSILFDLPLVINPLGILFLRREKQRTIIKSSSTEVDHLITQHQDEDDEHLTMLVSMDSKQLEDALFAAKTTSLWYSDESSTNCWVQIFSNDWHCYEY